MSSYHIRLPSDPLPAPAYRDSWAWLNRHIRDLIEEDVDDFLTEGEIRNLVDLLRPQAPPAPVPETQVMQFLLEAFLPNGGKGLASLQPNRIMLKSLAYQHRPGADGELADVARRSALVKNLAYAFRVGGTSDLAPLTPH